MKKIVIAAVTAALIAAGCGTRPTVLDGSATTLGVIVPDEASYYGFQIFSRVNGLELNAPTGAAFSVERETISSNRYLGIIHIDERTKTKIETK